MHRSLESSVECQCTCKRPKSSVAQHIKSCGYHLHARCPCSLQLRLYLRVRACKFKEKTPQRLHSGGARRHLQATACLRKTSPAHRWPSTTHSLTSTRLSSSLSTPAAPAPPVATSRLRNPPTNTSPQPLVSRPPYAACSLELGPQYISLANGSLVLESVRRRGTQVAELLQQTTR